MNLPRNKNLKQLSQRMRKNMTTQERHLWFDFLWKYPVKIYKQRIIGNYIVDFYCCKAKLVIELDGGHHYEKEYEEHDKHRTEYLNSLGLKVIRFSNRDVDSNFHSICNEIDKEIKIGSDK